MKRMIVCSFEPDSIGGFITINNGVHPDRPGHYSKTVTITKEAFNKACKDRHLFSDILGVDITQGWQNPLKDAISNCQNLKEPAPEKIGEFIIKANIEKRGEEAVKADMEAMEKQEEAIVKALEEKMKETETKENENGADDGNTVKKTGNRKRSKKSGSEDTAGTPADGEQVVAEQSGTDSL